MRCASCDQETADSPCTQCGEPSRLDGRYALVAPCGHGANGTTWEAMGPDGVRVALKELPLTLAGADKTRELWMREARVLQQLSHPQIPSLVEVFLAGTGRARTLCIVQEFVEGETLASELEHHRYTEQEVLEIAHDLAGVLDYLHGLSPPVVHRDLKPSNVMRRTDGTLVLVDFGSVRDVLKDADLGGSTTAGTFGYMAPEQFRGDAEPATDFYGLGCLMVALLTRKDPKDLSRRDGVLGWREHCSPSPGAEALITGLLAHEACERPVGGAAMQGLLERGFAEHEHPEAQALFEPQVQAQLPARPTNNALAATGPATAVAVLALSAVLTVILIVGLAVAALLMPAGGPTVAVPMEPRSVEAVVPVVPIHAVEAPRFLVYNTSDTYQSVGFLPGSGRTGNSRALAPGELGSVGMTEVIGVVEVASAARKTHFMPIKIPVEGPRVDYVECGPEGCVAKPFLEVAPASQEWSRPVLPQYPVEYVDRTVETCAVHLWLAPEGNVADALAVGCYSAFARASEAALRHWTYAPAERPMHTVIDVHFKSPTDPVVVPGQ